MTKPFLATLIFALIACTCPAMATSIASGATARGDLPGPGGAGVYAIRTAEQWQKFLSEVKTDWNISIDFERDMVLAVLLGTRNTAGYRVHIDEIRKGDWRTEVVFSETPPSPTAQVIQTLTNPYIITVTQQSAAPVLFSKGHFGTLQIPYEEYTRLIRQISETNYQLQDERRQKNRLEGRVRDLMDLMARTGPQPGN